MENEAIQKIQGWLNSSIDYLSSRTDYARGFKEGCRITRQIISDILVECGIKTDCIDPS